MNKTFWQLPFAANIATSNINDWNTSNVTSMKNCFASSAGNQNLNISNWNTKNVSDFSFMFQSSQFNGDISSWDTSSANNMEYMFDRNTLFNQDISSWDTSNVTTFRQMFYSTSGNMIFNQPIGFWDTSSATSLRYMLSGCASFDQDLSNWDINQVNDFTNLLEFGTLSRDNYDATLISWAAQAPLTNEAISFGNSQYTLGGAAEAARNTLINTYGWTITDGGGIAPAPADYTTDLVASYNFDSDFTDYTGTNNPSSTNLVTAGVAGGKVSNAVDFQNSLSSYIVIPDSDDFSFTDGVNDLPFSISLWVKFDTLGNVGAFVWKGGGPSDREYRLQTQTATQGFVIKIMDPTTNVLERFALSGVNIVTGNWYHIVATYDGSKTGAGLNLYVNGVASTETPVETGTYTGMVNSSFPLAIGNRADTLSALSIDGLMDEVHIWKNRELTAAEVTDIYNTENVGNSILPALPLLDTYTGAAAAYSLRDLSSSTTNVVRVRRSSDNTEQDFTSTQVTDGTLETFVGAGNDGFVVTWYDQSGAGNDITFSPAPAEQAQIVTSGSLNLDNGTPYMLSTGRNFGQASLASALTSTNGTLFCQYNSNDTAAGCLIAQDGSFYAGLIDSTSGSNAEQGMGTPAYYKNGNIVTPDARNNLYTAYVTNQDVLIGVTNLNLTNYTLVNRVYPYSYTVDSFTQIVKMKEWVLFDADQSANQSAIETNINDYYTIY